MATRELAVPRVGALRAGKKREGDDLVREILRVANVVAAIVASNREWNIDEKSRINTRQWPHGEGVANFTGLQFTHRAIEGCRRSWVICAVADVGA